MQKAYSLFIRYQYELVAFLTSGVLLSVEITGGRLLAPYFGLSSYVWTAMIGTILSFLSLGYWLGGRMADRNDPKNDIGVVIATGGLLLVISTIMTEPILSLIDTLQLDLRLSALLAASCLFGPASFLIGFISPHLAKIRVTSLKTSGASIGRLEAASALGSIFGTFFSGYVLLGFVGSRDIGLLLAITLIATSFIAEHKRLRLARVVILILSFVILITPSRGDAFVLLDTDSSHARYQVLLGSRGGEAARFLVTDGQSIQSGVYSNDPDRITLDYALRIADILDITQPETVATIGGAVHTMPRQLAERYDLKRSVSVEVDTALDEIAREYFFFDGEPVEAVYEDGRRFLRNSNDTFDAVIMDAFSATTPPFHLMTVETSTEIRKLLPENGVYVMNIVSDYPRGFVEHVVATQLEVFEDVIVVSDEDSVVLNRKQNFIVVAGDTSALKAIREKFNDDAVAVTPGEPLTDDFAPVERLTF